MLLTQKNARVICKLQYSFHNALRETLYITQENKTNKSISSFLFYWHSFHLGENKVYEQDTKTNLAQKETTVTWNKTDPQAYVNRITPFFPPPPLVLPRSGDIQVSAPRCSYEALWNCTRRSPWESLSGKSRGRVDRQGEHMLLKSNHACNS